MRSRIIFFTLLLLAGSFAVPHFAHAAGIPFFGPIIPGSDIAGDIRGSCPAGWGMLILVINNIIMLLLTLAFVFVAPIMIAYAGFLMVVNPYDSGGISKAKGILTNTIVGIVIALSAWLMIDAIMVTLYKAPDSWGTWKSLIQGGGTSQICIPQNATAATTPPPPGGGATIAPQPSVGYFNISNAIQYLNSMVGNRSSTGDCALYIRRALGDGGGLALFKNGQGNAYQFGPPLLQAGFKVVNNPTTVAPQMGDVIVFQPVTGHPYGHVEMYDGSRWISDYKQSSWLPSPDYQGGSYTVYRYPPS